MSKSRNRSVKILPHDFSSLIQKFSEDNKEMKNRNLDYFGENIQDVNIQSPYTPLFTEIPQSFSATSNSEIDSITLDLNKLSGLSSSSSLSWSDEYESEISQKVLNELERMDRVLRREEPIPLHYDKDEYEQWMNTFPNISIFDNHLTPVNSTHNIRKLLDEEDMELIIYGSDKHNFLHKDCDVATFNNTKKKSAVIDTFDNSSNRLLNQRNINTSRKRKLDENRNKNKSIFTISHKPKSLDTDKYLKISPIKNQFNERRLSSKSLLNGDVKDYADTTLEYNSLPFIKVEEPEFSKRNVASSNLQSRKNSTVELFRKSEGSHLVLPPIVTSNQFRSISATPRKGNKTFSALSMKFEANFKSQDRSRKSSIKFMDNPISNR
ncbi:uncharacterized protein LOC108912917 [Anoplophora glabripennis]|uniref:uncharacterized protein LOC108912917 n=1 Tax=Anoplophora glabripennis TaxID=217634 RepID=UPI0008747BE5|nr:uncharacterized protein LOC108912917 [Anoplophora glabripennis]